MLRISVGVVIGWIGSTQYQKWKEPTVSAKTLIDNVDEVDSATRRIEEIVKFGYPSNTTIRPLDNYLLAYDTKNRTAHWVFEHLTRDTLRHNDNVNRNKCEFTEDKTIHPMFRAQNLDYKRSGYDRGHLAAAGNHRLCQEHVNQTFLLSNIAPQVGSGFNRDSWNRLEKYVRYLAKKYRNVYVCTGPLYLPRRESDGKMYVKYEVIGQNNVAVPTHFFKVILAENEKLELDLEAYVMPNTVIDNDVPLRSFQVPVESIERAAGFVFFDKVPRHWFRSINGKR